MPYPQHKQELGWRSGWLQADASPSRPGLGPPPDPVQWTPGNLSPEVQNTRNVGDNLGRFNVRVGSPIRPRDVRLT